MPISKDTVKARWAAKLGKYSVPASFKESLMKRLSEAANVNTEEELDAQIDVYEPVVADVVPAIDKVREELKTPTPPTPTPTPEPVAPQLPADAPDYVKAIMQTLNTVNTELTKLKSEGVSKSLQERFLAHDKVKNIPALIRDAYIPKTEEEFEAMVEKVSTGYEQFAKEQNIQISGLDAPNRAPAQPTGGNVNKAANKKALDEWAQSKGLNKPETAKV